MQVTLLSYLQQAINSNSFHSSWNLSSVLVLNVYFVISANCAALSPYHSGDNNAAISHNRNSVLTEPIGKPLGESRELNKESKCRLYFMQPTTSIFCMRENGEGIPG